MRKKKKRKKERRGEKKGSNNLSFGQREADTCEKMMRDKKWKDYD